MKKNFENTILVVLAMTTCLIACKEKEKKNKTNADDLELIKSSINSSIGWAKNKDFDLLYSVIANDSNYLEVDPNPGIIKGIDRFRENESFWRSPDFKAVRYDIRDLTINLSEKGDVAWYYCILDDINEWKGKPVEWRNTRWTGVLEKRDRKWVIVQMHFSFAKE